MQLLNWLVPLALLWPLLWCVRVLLVARALAGLRFGRERVEPCSLDAVPAYVREASQSYIAEVTQLGFSLRQAWCEVSTNGPEFDSYEIELVHATEPTRALVRLHKSLARAGQCWLAFRTTLNDGRELATTSYREERILPLPTNLDWESLEEASAAELLARHRERVAAAGAAPVVLAADAALQREQAITDEVVAIFRDSGSAHLEPDGRLAWRFGSALKMAAQLIRAEAQRKRAAKKRGAAVTSPVLSAETQQEIDWVQYRQIGAVQRGRMAWVPKTLLMLGSLALFALALGWQTSSRAALILIGALIFHEGGHLLGMRWFGFRDIQLLFLPFLGGAAVGHDAKVLKPWQHLVILFLGPLPGLFIGLALLAAAWSGPSWLKQVAAILVFLNAFNLLPILPLDGGQIVDFAFASRFPRLRALFTVLSGVGLLAISVWAKGGTLLAAVGVFMLWRLPIEWKAARLQRELRRELPPEADEETVVRRLLSRLRGPDWKKLNATQRMQTARRLQHTLRLPRPGWGTMAFAFAAYCSPLWLGLPLVLGGVHVQGAATMRAAEARAVAAGLPLGTSRSQPAAVPEADNAAIPYGAAEEKVAALIKTNKRWLLADDTSSSEDPVVREIAALLREAAQRPAFVPLPDQPDRPSNRYIRHLATRWLAREARQKTRFGEPVEALLLVRDGLRLTRLFQRSPGWWSWQENETAQRDLWGGAEEALAAGGSVPAPLLTDLAGLADPAGELAFAREALIFDRLDSMQNWSHLVDQMQPTGRRVSFALRVFVALERLNPLRYRQYVEQIDEAIALRHALDEAQQGRWPSVARPASLENFDPVRYQLQQVGDLLARLQQARTALAASWQMTTSGQRPAGFAELQAPWWSGVPRHPATAELLGWTRIGSTEALVFAAALQSPIEAVEATPRMIWRLPAKK